MIWISIAVVIVVLLFVFGMYNSLVGKKNDVENAFASIDTILKKRYDLIPNLVAAVKQYMQHERGLLENITELRARAVSGHIPPDEAIKLNNEINKAMGGIMVAVENYPDLKASRNFIDLQRSLNEVEEQLSAARRAFNAAVTAFNNAVEMFPTNIMAGMMHYTRRQLFEIPEVERQTPDVKSLFE
jgi:LemA protein